MNGTSLLPKAVFVYDISSGTSTNFTAPNGAGRSYFAMIYADKIVAVGNLTGFVSPFTATISYCILPHSSTVQPCGAWKLLATGLPGAPTFNVYGPPAIHGDLVAWWTVNGLAYHRFSSNITEAVAFTPPAQPMDLSTNGEIIAFTLATHPANPNNCGPLEYVDTTSGSDAPVNTGLYDCSAYDTSISQYTIVSVENSTGHNRLQYYDYLRKQTSTPGQGPLGNFTYVDNPTIWGNRIVFTASETSLNFDCDGDGQIQATQTCLQYWNIRSPSYVASTLAARAAPAISGPVAIYDKLIVFKGSNGNLQYVTVPMQGDVNQDGVVDNTDKNLVTSCLNQLLKGTIC